MVIGTQLAEENSKKYDFKFNGERYRPLEVFNEKDGPVPDLVRIRNSYYEVEKLEWERNGHFKIKVVGRKEPYFCFKARGFAEKLGD